MNTELPSRRSVRLVGYDYSIVGVYFVTICGFRRSLLFGEIRDSKMNPNALGKLVEAVWRELPSRFPSVELDASCVMPNHLHGIVVLHGKGRAEASSAPTKSDRCPTLARVVQSFKSLAYLRVRKQMGRDGPLWQRNYYEHIVRTGDALASIQGYIWDNPMRWEFDRENPQAKPPSNLSVESWEI